MDTKLIDTAAGVIDRARKNGKQTPAGEALALESACLLQSPESAAETARLRAENAALIVRLGVLEAERHSTNEALSQLAEQAHRDQVLLAEVARQRLREGLAAEARHQMDPLDRAFQRLACDHPEACGCAPVQTLPADMTHTDCGMPLNRRLACGHCPHEVCEDCDRCPCSCRCASETGGAS